MAASAFAASTLIDARTLRDRLARCRVIDCSHDLARPEAGSAEFRAGHVPGAVHAHLDHDLSGAKTGTNGRHPLPEPAAFAAWLGRQGIGRHDAVVAYDRSGGMYAARLWWLLRWLGHADVCVLDGGWQAWVEQGGEVAADAPRYDATRYEASAPAAAMWVDAGFVLRNLQTGEALVVDARGAERYRGVVEPIDARAGHIPGALNRPYTDNLAATGGFKSAAQLSDEWRTLLGARPANEVVAQCGSGVTACHNLLALEAAGLGGARLYPGSWSEWASDPHRPTATGA
ncbi:sulfurtransferase [Paraburkholderia acidisoli]|uniref:Sulfurtransferase n=1 Tax=Paraburkholderia acidisoli TaxID=2571748 RepID=A0A7Z2GKG4_9BURK|nr:sulfurtransferase [Paraburkholderia acidisoli]QGZ63356.1 sulfurtransferase [Paraburkholderia acidisoli]